MAAVFPGLLDEYVRFLNESIARLEAEGNSNSREIISQQIGPGQSAMVDQLKKTRLNEIMSGINVDTTMPPHIKILQDRLIDLLSKNRQMTSIDDVFISLEDDINRISNRGNNFNRWAADHPDDYDSLLLSYLRSIGNQGGGRRRNKRRSRRHRKKSKNTRRH